MPKDNTIRIDRETFYKDATPEKLARALLKPAWRDKQIPPPPIPDRMKKRRGDKKES